MKYFFIAAVSILAIACNQAGDQETDSRKDTVATDAGVVKPAVSTTQYLGVLPCADCEGIETEIDVRSDNTYLVHSIYHGKKSKADSSNEISETGNWMLHGTDTIHLADRKNAPSMYIRTDTSLIQLDKDGKRITGKLADKYILKKK